MSITRWAWAASPCVMACTASWTAVPASSPISQDLALQIVELVVERSPRLGHQPNRPVT